jgi:transcriptional regulator with XRE-family HTH domain
MKIYEKIRLLRFKTGMIQKEIAEILGTKQTTFASWETGRSIPDYKALKSLIELGKKYDIEFTFDDILSEKLDRRDFKKNKTECE